MVARVDRRAVDDGLPQLGHVPRRDGLGEGENLGEAVGIPISPASRLGSGMTERHVKLTRLPIMFMRKRPCLRSSSCFTPAGSLSSGCPIWSSREWSPRRGKALPKHAARAP